MSSLGKKKKIPPYGEYAFACDCDLIWQVKAAAAYEDLSKIKNIV